MLFLKIFCFIAKKSWHFFFQITFIIELLVSHTIIQIQKQVKIYRWERSGEYGG